MLATEIDTHKDVVSRLASEYGIEPSVWIGKENLIPFVKESFPDCLILDKNKLVAGSSKFACNLSFADLSELDSYWDSTDFRDQRVNLLEEFNRYPSLGNLRTLDREVLLRQLQLQIFSALREKAPDFLFALDTPHNPVNLSAFYLVKWLGIPRLFFSGTGSFVPALIPQTEIGKISGAAGLISESRSGAETEAKEFNLEIARDTIARLASETKVHWQSFEQERIRSYPPKKFQVVRDFRVKVKRSILRKQDPDGATTSDFIDRSYTQLVRSHSRLPVLEDAPKHGLFLLHYQPESSVVPAGFDDTFQAKAVIKARQLLAPDVPLLVKEHPGQLNHSMEGSLGRSQYFYDLIEALPNTSAISSTSLTERLLNTTQAVFTLTGSVGVEAAIKGIPLVHFGPGGWWAGLPGTFDARLPTIASELAKYSAPRLEDIQTHILELVGKASIPGFADSGTRDYWEGQMQFPRNYQAAFVDRIVRSVSNFAHNLPHG